MWTCLSYTEARRYFADLWDAVETSRRPVTLTRRGHRDLTLLPAADYRRLEAEAHLLRSPENARRLLRALDERLPERTWASTAELAADLGLGG